MNDDHPTPQDDSQPVDINRLSDIVQMEANRILSEEQLQPDPALVAQGWERRFMGDAKQIKEAVDLYTELGYEVLTVPVRPDELSNDCAGCRLVVVFQFQTLYVRSGGYSNKESKE